MYDNGAACMPQTQLATASETKAARNLSPIEEAHRSINKSLDIAHDQISILTQRLESVLSPELAEPPPANTPGQPHASTMHGQLLNSANGAEAIGRRIDALLRRLTL